MSKKPAPCIAIEDDLLATATQLGENIAWLRNDCVTGTGSSP